MVLLALPLRIIKRFEVPEVEPSRATAQAAHHEVRFEAAVGIPDVVRDVSDLRLHSSQVITPDKRRCVPLLFVQRIIFGLPSQCPCADHLRS